MRGGRLCVTERGTYEGRDSGKEREGEREGGEGEGHWET